MKRMANETYEAKTEQLKVTVQESLMREIEEFVSHQKVLKNKTDLVETALRFYMESFKRSGHITDGNRFPLRSAARVMKHLADVDDDQGRGVQDEPTKKGAATKKRGLGGISRRE